MFYNKQEMYDSFGRLITNRAGYAGGGGTNGSFSANHEEFRRGRSNSRERRPSFTQPYSSSPPLHVNNVHNYNSPAQGGFYANASVYRANHRSPLSPQQQSFPYEADFVRTPRSYGNNDRATVNRTASLRPSSTLYCMNTAANPNQPPLPADSIAPLQSFKSFLQRNPQIAPDSLQDEYKKYCTEYLDRYSDSVFRTVAGEEWFQDKYSPVQLWAKREEAKNWAHQESANFRMELSNWTTECLNACSIEPAAKHSQFREPLDTSATHNTTSSDSPDIAGKHLPGHEHRAVYLSEIHACCPKSHLRESIRLALEAANAAIASTVSSDSPSAALNLLPERILISAPTWSKHNDKFDRSAWVIFSSHAAARRAVETLKNFEIEVLHHPDTRDEQPRIAAKFKLNAVLHTGRLLNSLPESVSTHSRVQVDLQRALRLVKLLDDEQNIEVENRFLALVCNETMQQQINHPVQLLDLCLAYLRRVHLLCYYAGRRFYEESSVLAYSSSVVFRSKSALALKFKSDLSAVDDEVTEAVEPFSVSKTIDLLLSQSDLLTTMSDQIPSITTPAKQLPDGQHSLEDGEEERKDNIGGDVPDNAAQAPAVTEKAMSLSSDKRIIVIIDQITNKDSEKIMISLQNDAMKLQQIQDESFESLVRSTCKFEQEEKCRCCFVNCNKLFKAVPFLTKHLRTKHEGFGSKILVQGAIPFMKQRYEDDPISDRPLPPVEVETAIGVECQSVKNVLEKLMTSATPPPVLTTPPAVSVPVKSYVDRRNPLEFDQDYSYRRKRGNDDYPNPNIGLSSVGYGRERQQSYDDRDSQAFKRSRTSESAPLPPTSPPPAQVPTTGPAARKMLNYFDVDAPKEQLVAIDHGPAVVVIPRKRKFGTTKANTDQPEARPVERTNE